MYSALAASAMQRGGISVYRRWRSASSIGMKNSAARVSWPSMPRGALLLAEIARFLRRHVSASAAATASSFEALAC